MNRLGQRKEVATSGSTQGAGGVGGLLVEKQGCTAYYTTYDGNISEYLNDADVFVAQFEYDASGGVPVHYTHDAQSRRIAKTVGCSTTCYLYEGWNCIAEYEDAPLSFIAKGQKIISRQSKTMAMPQFSELISTFRTNNN